jgi:hypothetical protein
MERIFITARAPCAVRKAPEVICLGSLLLDPRKVVQRHASTTLARTDGFLIEWPTHAISPNNDHESTLNARSK